MGPIIQWPFKWGPLRKNGRHLTFSEKSQFMGTLKEVCFWLRSDVTTRAQACFGHCKRCKRCVFLRACHINYLLGLGWRQDCFAQCRRCKKCVFLRACHVHCHAGLGWGGMGCVNIRCTWTHVWCYATVGVGVGWGGMGCVNIRCTWTHVWCYAATVGVGWDGMC